MMTDKTSGFIVRQNLCAISSSTLQFQAIFSACRLFVVWKKRDASIWNA